MLDILSIIALHKKWLQNNKDGVKADLSGANLSYANLSCADLSHANLSRADLSGANLSDANLSRADLSCANLSHANLSDANLSDANLSRANLSRANLSRADLSGANLSDANLSDANLSRADLSGANLSYANLSDANLSDANLSGAILSAVKFRLIYDQYFCIVPDGELIVWKALANGAIAKLCIPKKARRINYIASRKCRASYAKVIAIFDDIGNSISRMGGLYDKQFVYTAGKIIRPNSFDDKVNIECSNGIHFFLTKQEAINYGKLQ